jgi:GTPase-associated system-like protein
MARHPNFADWYRPAGTTPSEQLLDSRWRIVEKFAKQPSTSLLLKLATLFAVPGQTESAVPTEFREAFEQDQEFPFRDNLYELRVAAGATLRLVIDQADASSSIAALAVICGTFATRRSLVPYSEHVETANRFAMQYSRKIRESSAQVIGSSPVWTKAKITAALPADLFAANDLPKLHEPLVKTLSDMNSATFASLKEAQAAIEQLSCTARVREEEVAMLWWLQTRFSRDLLKPFSEIGHVAGTLLIPMELADLTKFPIAVEVSTAILAHGLQLSGASRGQTVTISEAIDALPLEWRRKVCAQHEIKHLAPLTPLLLAIRTSAQHDTPTNWASTFRKECEIPLDQPLPVLHIAVQLHHERMLLKATAGIKQ